MGDQSLIYLIMGLAGLFLSGIPFGVYMGLATTMGITDPNSSSLLVMLYVIVIFVTFLASLGSFAAIQNQNCGKVKNFKQIASNAGISTLIVTLSLSIAVFIPFLKNIVGSIVSPDIEPTVKEALGYAYFLFWGGLYGFSAGGYMSAVCGD
jgi:uncharacterized membrane protein